MKDETCIVLSVHHFGSVKQILEEKGKYTVQKKIRKIGIVK
jgi:hypothetical protein